MFLHTAGVPLMLEDVAGHDLRGAEGVLPLLPVVELGGLIAWETRHVLGLHSPLLILL